MKTEADKRKLRGLAYRVLKAHQRLNKQAVRERGDNWTSVAIRRRIHQLKGS